MIRSLGSAALPGYLVSLPLFFSPTRQGDKTEEEPRYDPVTVIEVIGTVISVRVMPPGNPLSGLHLLIRTDTAEIDAYLGPTDFLKDFESFTTGDATQLSGSRVAFGGGHVVLAREVREGEEYLYLRDKSGRPNRPARRSPTT